MSSQLSAQMEFEVGDQVYMRSALHDARHVPTRHTVLERYAQECHGGIQRLYKLEPGGPLYPEVALSRKRPPYEPTEGVRLDDVTREARAAAGPKVWAVEKDQDGPAE